MVRALRYCGIATKFGVQPCPMFKLWVTSVMISLMMMPPAQIVDVIAALEVSDHAAHVASRDAAVVEAEVGQLGSPVIPLGTWFINKPSMTCRTASAHARVAHSGAAATQRHLVRRLRLPLAAAWTAYGRCSPRYVIVSIAKVRVSRRIGIMVVATSPEFEEPDHPVEGDVTSITCVTAIIGVSVIIGAEKPLVDPVAVVDLAGGGGGNSHRYGVG